MFFATGDYERHLHWLGEALRTTRTTLHAYVLMTNHVHLLLTPQGEAAIPSLMMSLGRRYVQSVNNRYKRTGTLWDGRFHASVVSTDSYMLACQRYIELNPVRAGIVADPAQYRWSSFKRNALGLPNDLISTHPTYEELGRNDIERRIAYRQLFESEQAGNLVAEIRLATHQNQPFGSTSFQDAMTAATGTVHRVRPRGRQRVVRSAPFDSVERDQA